MCKKLNPGFFLTLCKRSYQNELNKLVQNLNHKVCIEKNIDRALHDIEVNGIFNYITPLTKQVEAMYAINEQSLNKQLKITHINKMTYFRSNTLQQSFCQ